MPRDERADIGGIGGTVAANVLSLAATRATLDEVLTDEAFEHMIALGERFEAGVADAIERHDLPWHVRASAAGSSTSSARAPRERAARRGRRRRRARPAHPPVRAQPRHPADAVPQHGADVARDDGGRRRPAHGGLRRGRPRAVLGRLGLAASDDFVGSPAALLHELRVGKLAAVDLTDDVFLGTACGEVRSSSLFRRRSRGASTYQTASRRGRTSRHRDRAWSR